MKIGTRVKPQFLGQFPNVLYNETGEIIERSKERGNKDRVLVRFPKCDVWESETYLQAVQFEAFCLSCNGGGKTLVRSPKRKDADFEASCHTNSFGHSVSVLEN